MLLPCNNMHEQQYRPTDFYSHKTTKETTATQFFTLERTNSESSNLFNGWSESTTVMAGLIRM